MAKKSSNEEPEINLLGEQEDTELNNEKNDSQNNEKNDSQKAVVSSAKKNVKIRATEDIDCLIACKVWKIAKDKEASVPVDVAAILCYAKKAYRL